MRNSHGYTWGESGHFKLSKEAKEECFVEAVIPLFDIVSPDTAPVEIYENINGSVVRRKLRHQRLSSCGGTAYCLIGELS